MKNAAAIVSLALGVLVGGCGNGSAGSGGGGPQKAILPPPAVELPLLQGPPISPRCELASLPSYQKQRRYITCDLNGDALPEYLIEDISGVHRTGFALVDSRGELLTDPSDVGEIGGDRLVILTSQHHGYHDVLCSDSDPGGIAGHVWSFDGRQYVRGRAFEYAAADRARAFVESTSGSAMAFWYSDIFAGPALYRSTSQPVSTSVSTPASAPASVPATAPAGAEWIKLFSDEPWYKDQAGKEEVFAGKLEAVPQAGGATILMRTSLYKLGDRTIYTGAKKVPALDRLVGKKVEIRRKAVDMELEGQNL